MNARVEPCLARAVDGDGLLFFFRQDRDRLQALELVAEDDAVLRLLRCLQRLLGDGLSRDQVADEVRPSRILELFQGLVREAHHGLPLLQLLHERAVELRRRRVRPSCDAQHHQDNQGKSGEHLSADREHSGSSFELMVRAVITWPRPREAANG